MAHVVACRLVDISRRTTPVATQDLTEAGGAGALAAGAAPYAHVHNRNNINMSGVGSAVGGSTRQEHDSAAAPSAANRQQLSTLLGELQHATQQAVSHVRNLRHAGSAATAAAGGKAAAADGEEGFTRSISLYWHWVRGQKAASRVGRVRQLVSRVKLKHSASLIPACANTQHCGVVLCCRCRGRGGNTDTDACTHSPHRHRRVAIQILLLHSCMSCDPRPPAAGPCGQLDCADSAV